MGKNNSANVAAQKQSKQKSVIITLCVILAAILVIGLVVYTRLDDSGVILRSQTAAKSEHFSVSGSEMAYFYTTNYQNYATYLSYLGADTSKSLKTQECSYLEDGGTWFDYFLSITKDYVTQLLSICENAYDAGLTLSDIDSAEVEASLEALRENAKTVGYSTNQYLKAFTGNGVTEKDVKKCLELTALASLYSDQFENGLTYTDDEIEAEYEANSGAYDGVDYLVYTVAAGDFMEKDANGNPVGETTAASASAKEAADALAASDSREAFEAGIRDYVAAHKEGVDADQAVENACVRHGLASSLSSVSDWAFSAQAGDTTVTGVEGDTTFTVYYLLTPSYRDESLTRSVRHILFTTDTYEDDAKAQEIYAEWESAGFSIEKFEELALAYSEDTGSSQNGGLYENMIQGQTVPDFDNWLFDESRKVGDHDLIESSYGWHIMYYEGEGSESVWKQSAVSNLKNADFTEMCESKMDSVSFSDSALNRIYA